MKVSFTEKNALYFEVLYFTGASPRKFLWRSFVKSWTFYLGKYSDLSEGATKTK